MAENQSLKAPKQAKREIEQEIEENKHLVEPQNSIRSIGAVSDCLTDEAVMKKNGSQAEPHLESLLNLPDSDAKPVIATPLASVGPEESKGQFAVSHQQALASVTAQAAQHQEHKQLQAEYQLPLVPLKPSEASAISPRSLQQRPSTLEQDSNACTPECDSDSSPDKDIKPIPLKPSVASAISPRPLQQRPATLEQDSNACKPECDGGSSSDKEIKPTRFTVKTPTNDGFNWRKYGQKPVKSSESSRSYYRCTTADCHAKKKVEFCDKTGNVTEIVYKGQHNHNPPQQTRHSKLKRLAASFVPLSSSGTGGGSGLIDCPIIADFYSDPSSSSRELTRATPDKQLKAEEPDQAIIIKSEDCIDEPNSKHSRKKGTSFAYSPSLFKHVKDSKVVVQAPGDVSISGDGYRWRKYGQKMVKGNPYPRSYYKCTFAGGCPVRKHVERSTEDTNSFIITYEGKHEHEKPVPRKCHDLASTIPLTPTTPAVDSAEVNKSKDLATHKVSAQWSMDIESPATNQKATEFGGQKALESARTLLSIGIELRPY